MKEISEIVAAMDALEALIAAFEQHNRCASQKSEWANRTALAIEPTKWTRKIEAALDKPDELNALRIQYDECVLTFVSSILQYEHERRQVMDTISPMCDGIKALVKLLDSPEARALSKHLVPAIKSLVLRASAAHRAPRAECEVRAMDALADRSREYGVLVSSFGVLTTELRRVNIHSPQYSTGLVTGRDVQPQFSRDVDMSKVQVVYSSQKRRELGHSRDVDLRNVFVVPFVDCLNSQHPHSAALVQAYATVDAALEKVRNFVKNLRGDHNGSVNERQHASRMLDLLHGAPQGCGGNIDSQVNAQNQRRLEYEMLRIQIVAAMDELQTAYNGLVVTLVKAADETATLLAETQANGRTTVDRKDAVRAAMNNCLAVDVYLRRVGREIAELQNGRTRDLTLGNGAAALDASYEEVAKQYRY
ncbi:MAG: hypothetical protein JST44_08225 [Cyanobacteria bacterium SZAS LIN-5]|nr:hypothetical protein [Cyanobacteria bacterium SZAS LIN-5]